MCSFKQRYEVANTRVRLQKIPIMNKRPSAAGQTQSGSAAPAGSPARKASIAQPQLPTTGQPSVRRASQIITPQTTRRASLITPQSQPAVGPP